MGIKSDKVQGRISTFDVEGKERDLEFQSPWYRQNAANRQENSVSWTKTAVSYSIFELRLRSLHRKLRFFVVNLQFERKQFHHIWIYVPFLVYFTVD